jgi:transcriptional regulator with XRE-family HTH domain
MRKIRANEVDVNRKIDGCVKLTPESMARAAEVLRKRLQARWVLGKRTGRYKSQREMAIKLEITPETLSRWLRGRTTPNPTLSKLELFADEIGLPLAGLISEGDGPPPAGTITVAEAEKMIAAAVSRARGEIREEVRAELLAALSGKQ